MFELMQKNVEKVTKNYSPNFDLKKRRKNKIKYLIFHYTGMKNDKLAIKKLTNFNSNVSCHYYITALGKLIQMVPDSYVAWHAGKSKWGNDISLNKSSIGIEIHNRGHQHGYEKFTSKQINSLKQLLKQLIKLYKIDINNILGHSDIAPNRKKDPGEKFPWKILAKSNLAKWHTLNENELKKDRSIRLNEIEESKFLENLYIIGYNRIKKLNYNSNKKNLLKAFQRRFRQSLINGKSDKECLLISKNLLKS